jgi:hypothetical protein
MSKQVSMNREQVLNQIKRLTRQGWQYGDAEPPRGAGGAPLSADAWQEFKRKFVHSYGGELVNSDGLTHRELLRYLRDGYREGDEPVEQWL